MVSPQTSPSVPATGLPPGVEPGPLGARAVAFLVDAVVPSLILVVAFVVGGAAVRVVVSLIVLFWAGLVCWMLTLRAASPGMRLTRLQLVGFSDGRPLGWSRVLVRALLLLVLAATGVGLVVVAAFLAQHPRRQGWHDLVANAVVIKERPIAPPKPKAGTARQDSYGVTEPQLARSSADPALSSPGPALSSPGQVVNSPAPTHVGTIDSHGEPLAAALPAKGPDPVTPELFDADHGTARQTSSASAGIALANQELTTAGASAVSPAPESAVTDRAAPESGVSQQSQDWVAVLDDGREINVAALVLLGRNPQARPGEDDAELIKVADDTRTVSKTHLALGVDGKGMYVMDRGSTNGSTVTNARGVSKPCPAGETVSVAAGNIVSFGEHWLEVRRGG